MTHYPFRPVSLIYTADEIAERLSIYPMPPTGEPSIYYRPGGAGPLLKEVGELVATDSMVMVFARLDISEHDHARLCGLALNFTSENTNMDTGWNEDRALLSTSIKAATTVLVNAESDPSDHTAALTPWPVSEDSMHKATTAAARRIKPAKDAK